MRGGGQGHGAPPGQAHGGGGAGGEGAGGGAAAGRGGGGAGGAGEGGPGQGRGAGADDRRGVFLLGGEGVFGWMVRCVDVCARPRLWASSPSSSSSYATRPNNDTPTKRSWRSSRGRLRSCVRWRRSWPRRRATSASSRRRTTRAGPRMRWVGACGRICSDMCVHPNDRL